MIELLPETKDNLIAVRFAGTVTEADMDGYIDRAEALLDRERVEGIVLDWSELQGWATGARSVGTWFGMHHWAMVAKVAIIADERWADETLRITDIFKAALVRRFDPSRRADAVNWVGEI